MADSGSRIRKIIPRLLIIAVVIAVLSSFYLAGGARWLSLKQLLEQLDTLQSLVHRHYLAALLTAGVAYTLMAALSIPGGTVMSLLIGFLFGRWVGGTVIVISATLGAGSIFLMVRYLIGDAVRRHLERKPQAARLLHGFEHDAFNYLLFVRLVPLFPFWLVNLASAFTAMRMRQFIFGTFIGIMPGCFIYANVGEQLGNIQSVHGLISPGLITAMVLLGFLALLPVAVRWWRTTHPNEV